MTRIDVHHHILPPFYVEAMGSHAIGAQGSSGRVPAWSVADALAKMDAAGIDTAITSVSAPGFAGQPLPARAELARRCNDFAAGMVAEHAGRFGMFAAVPSTDADAALAEIARAYDALHADGVCLLSNYDGAYLGEPVFSPIHEELDRRQAVVFVHPTSPVVPVPVGGLSASSVDFTFDTARAMASIIFGGVLQRYPRIRFIFSHMGGAMPYIAERIGVLARNNPALQAYIPQGISTELRKLYFDTALSANRVTFAAMMEIGSADNILFGSDYPFGPKDQMQDAVDSLARLGLQPGEIARIDSGNAGTLFPRFAAPA
ncbi:amidohydrolase [Verticiella sediminum]|uniref:Amidohydrolase n=1 Tax=Verticiella sediminum TaxID=1247510 RepID=A0A556AWL8_9BURK|nr:amidohydrolase family protein [Verticiella sediminum]TSH97324.1 amidohydrolase [Verticiella sediminum]